MKRIRGVVAGLALAAVMFAPRAAEAQVQLGWNSSLQVLCLVSDCSQVQFTLVLSGILPTTNTGAAVPAPILALGSPGYVSSFTIDIFTGPGLFSSASVVSGGAWITTVTGGGFTIDGDQGTPLVGGNVVVNATLTTGGAYAFGYSGLAYIDTNTNCFDAAGNVIGGPGIGLCGAGSYRQGDFNGLGTNVPEPMTMGLMATGLVGLALVGYRRKKNTQV
jgi:hypothetical protein